MSEADEERAKQPERKQTDDAQRRAAGAAFDERMKEFAADAPRAPRPDQQQRRKRR